MKKFDVLSYLEQHPGATAKEVGMDSGTTAASASEALERCVEQRLVTRDPKLRPREFSLTPEGVKRLEFYRRENGQGAESATSGQPSAEQPHGAPGAVPPAAELTALREDVRSLRQGLEERASFGAKGPELIEGIRNLLRGLDEAIYDPESASLDAGVLLVAVLEPSVALGNLVRESLSSEEAAKLDDLSDFADSADEDVGDEGHSESPQHGKADEKTKELYEARCKLAELGLFAEKKPIRARIAELEAQLPPETVQRIARLVQVEGESHAFVVMRDVHDLDAEIARLRSELGLPIVEK